MGLYDLDTPRKKQPKQAKHQGLVKGLPPKKKHDPALRRGSHQGLVSMLTSEDDVAGPGAMVRKPSFAPLRKQQATMSEVIVDKLMLDAGMTRPGTYQNTLAKELQTSQEDLERIARERDQVSQEVGGEGGEGERDGGGGCGLPTLQTHHSIQAEEEALEQQLHGAGEANTTDSWWQAKQVRDETTASPATGTLLLDPSPVDAVRSRFALPAVPPHPGCRVPCPC